MRGILNHHDYLRSVKLCSGNWVCWRVETAEELHDAFATRDTGGRIEEKGPEDAGRCGEEVNVGSGFGYATLRRNWSLRKAREREERKTNQRKRKYGRLEGSRGE